MTKGKMTFKKAYLVYVLVLALLVLGAVLHVRGLLKDYEQSQPERRVEEAVETLRASAADGSFWDTYGQPDWENGVWEEDRDLKAGYLAQYEDEALTFVEKRALSSENELVYHVVLNGYPLAEVRLKAVGPTVTKLAVFSTRPWETESVTALLEPRDLTLVLPESITASVNGKALTEELGTEKGSKREYLLEDLHMAPALTLTDAKGNSGSYRFQEDRVLVELYDYDLRLPQGIAVTVNGAADPGEPLQDGSLSHRICLLAKPEVLLKDAYGNEVSYNGEHKLPLVDLTVYASEDYTVKVDGAPVDAAAVSLGVNPDFEGFADFVELPRVVTSQVSVLRSDAVVTVDGPNGTETLSADRPSYEFGIEGTPLPEVPAEVQEQVDVLRVAQNWSLFLSRDLKFSRLVPSLLKGSYQYEVADKYAHGVDITFSSNHVLLDPAFTEESVANFTWISEDCFSVDIHFVKHMLLSRGQYVDDEMNDRFYFVRYDDSKDGKDNPAWKLAGMKEILDHAE